MRRIVVQVLGVPTGICLLGAVAAQPARHASAPHATIASFSWLAGCWVEDLGAVRVIDEWAAPTGHTMLGVSRELRGDSTIALELRTLSDSEGAITLMTISGAGQLHFHSARHRGAGVELVDTTGGRHTVLRFERDGARQLEIDRERQVGNDERTLNELFERVSCGGLR